MPAIFTSLREGKGDYLLTQAGRLRLRTVGEMVVPHDGAARNHIAAQRSVFVNASCCSSVRPSVVYIIATGARSYGRTSSYILRPHPDARATQLSMSITALTSLKHLLDRSTPVVDRPVV